jgi:hypothetical protein
MRQAYLLITAACIERDSWGGSNPIQEKGSASSSTSRTDTEMSGDDGHTFTSADLMKAFRGYAVREQEDD